MNMSFAD